MVTDRTGSLDVPVAARMHQDYAALRVDQTVGDALDWLRQHPPAGRILYLYVVDEAGKLVGVVPTRRMLVSARSVPLADIMSSKVTALPARSSVMEACEFFILYRLLAFPVVDDDGRMLGVVDIELYTDELERLEMAAPASRLLRPFADFLKIESAAGVVLLCCTIVALLLANSGWAEWFAALWQTPIAMRIGNFEFLAEPILFWINDGLMTLFFFVVGLEVKREFVAGELKEWRKAALPVVAAAGGMLAPALVYLALHWGKPTMHGWGIPTATDIAFVVGFLVLLGPRVPHGLKVMLLSLAIVDDIGAILVIVVGYSSDVSLPFLGLGLLGMAVVLLFRWAGVRSIPAYVVLGGFIWLAFVKSGVHPTIAGVALGLMTPARAWLGDRVPFDLVTESLKRLRGFGRESAPPREPTSPLERLEQALHPWVAFGIMPLFALSNAGVAIQWHALGEPIALGVAAGLIFGKPIGIVLFSLGSAWLGFTKLPTGVNVKVLIGGGCLAGIGFTMSIFISNLAFEDNALHLDEAKIGILFGSAVSATLGSCLLRLFLRSRVPSSGHAPHQPREPEPAR